MNNSMKHHPAVCLAPDIRQICTPLEALDIHYFSHVRITADNQFSALCNKAHFAEYYVEKQYYNADIHLAENNIFGNYILWDLIGLKGKSALLLEEAHVFGHRHIFTIVKEEACARNFYHFATHLNNPSINQSYIKNIELLEKFIIYFNDKMALSRELQTAYEIRFGLDNQCNFSSSMNNSHQDQKTLFLEHINCKPQKFLSLTPQQHKCMALLAQGYSNKQIAYSLNLSKRTVEHYFETIRKKTQCRNSRELILLYLQDYPLSMSL